MAYDAPVSCDILITGQSASDDCMPSEKYSVCQHVDYIRNFSCVLQVKKQWLLYCEKMDVVLEEACRLNVKWSLQELSHAVQGNRKTPPRPLLRIYAVLDEPGGGETPKV